MKLDLVVEAKGKDGFRESPSTVATCGWERVTLSMTRRGQGGAVLREGTKRLLTAPLAPKAHATLPNRVLLPILGSQCQASHQDVGDKSHSCGT